MARSVQDRISEIHDVRAALDAIAEAGGDSSGGLQLAAGLVRGMITFAEGWVTSARLTSGALVGARALEEMLKIDEATFSFIASVPIRKSERCWIQVQALIANKYSLVGLTTDEPPEGHSEAPTVTDATRRSSDRLPRLSSDRLPRLSSDRLPRYSSDRMPAAPAPTPPNSESSASAQAASHEAAAIAPEEPITTAPEASANALPEASPPAAPPEPFIHAPHEEQAFPHDQPEPASETPAASSEQLSFAADGDDSVAPTQQETSDETSSGAISLNSLFSDMTVAPKAPSEVSFSPSVESFAPQKSFGVEPEISFDPKVEPTERDSNSSVESGSETVAESNPEANSEASPEADSQVSSAAGIEPANAQEDEPFEWAPPGVAPNISFSSVMLAVGEEAASTPDPNRLDDSFFDSIFDDAEEEVQKETIKEELSDADRWMLAQEAGSSPAVVQREQFAEANPEMAPVETAKKDFVQQPRVSEQSDFSLTALNAIPTPGTAVAKDIESSQLEDVDYKPLIAMPEDAFGTKIDKEVPEKRSLIKRRSTTTEPMPGVERMMRKHLRSPERIATPIIFVSLVIGLVLLPNSLRQAIADSKVDGIAAQQVEMTLNDEAKDQVPYAINDHELGDAPVKKIVGGGDNTGKGAPGVVVDSDEQPGRKSDAALNEISIRQARALVDRGQVKEAVALYREYIRKNPKAFEIRIELIKVLMQGGLGKEAKDECIAALTRGPSMDQNAELSILLKRASLMKN